MSRVVIGGINGQFIEVFKKLSALHAKNSFSIAIVWGDFFADPSSSSASDEENLTALLNGSITVPLSTYFSVGKNPLPPRIVERLASRDGEVCENLHFLGKRTVLNTAEGVKIVALGGQLDPSVAAGLSKDEYTPFHTASDVTSLQDAKETDLLLTYTWPLSIRTGSKVPLPDGASEPPGSELVAGLCSSLRPRYHFSSSPELFFEREPFSHPDSDGDPQRVRITRFISLASFRNAAKQKWLYAFNIDLAADQTTTAPTGVTASPFSHSSRKRALPSQNESYSRFSGINNHRPSKRARPPPPGPESCFFCLSNPNLATHLIASIGNDAYLTIARGPLSSPKTYPSLGLSAHILIIPLTHSPTLADISEPAARASTIGEMNRYRRALQSMVHARSKGQLGAVTWEVSRKRGVHTHWQFMPIGNDMVTKGLVEAAFRVEAENEKYPALEVITPDEIPGTTDDFFRVWIWSSQPSSSDGNDRTSTNTSTSEESCLLPFPPETRFDLQFGRRVLAKLLHLDDRVNWKSCLQSAQDESAEVDAFKAAFQEFDFSLLE